MAEIIRCSFCGRNGDEVRAMIQGKQTTAICDLCVLICVNMIFEKVVKFQGVDAKGE